MLPVTCGQGAMYRGGYLNALPGKDKVGQMAKPVVRKRVKVLKEPDKFPCLRCGKGFVRVRKWQKFCSIRCWQTDYNQKTDKSGKMRELRASRKAENGEYA